MEEGGGGGAYIKFKVCPFAIYSCVMEKGVSMLYFIFHPFGINLLDIAFGVKFHISSNLGHTVRVLDWLVVLWFNATLTAKVIS